MPALTASSVIRSLTKFLAPDEQGLDVLNMVLPRIYAMGYWRDLLVESTIETDHRYFALPDDCESVIAAMVSDQPQQVYAQWHDYKIAGLTGTGPAPLFGVIDDGFASTMIDLARSSETYQFQIDPIAPATVLPSEGTITIIYEDEGEDTRSYTFTLAGAATMTTAFASDDRAISVQQIRFNNVRTPARFQDATPKVKVTATAVSADGDDLIIATGRGDSIARYRRYRFSNERLESKIVNLLCKRGFEPLVSEADLVYLGDINAIKHGMLATLAEDNADIDRASYHWQVCAGLLENQMSAYRGAVKPRIMLDPAMGAGHGVPNMM